MQDYIEQRIFRLEGLLGAKVNRSKATDPAPKTPRQDIFYGSLYFAGYNLGDISSQVGIPVFSQDGLKWIQERTGESRLFEGVYSRPGSECPYKTTAAARGEMGIALPPMGIALSSFNVYCASPLSRVFPMIDRESFLETIRQAYEVNGAHSAGEYLAARTCVLAFLATVALLEPNRLNISFAESSAFALEAHDSLIHAVAASPIQGLQAALALVS